MSEENNRHKLNKIISETNIEEGSESEDSGDDDNDNNNIDNENNSHENKFRDSTVDETINNNNKRPIDSLKVNSSNVEIIENVKNDTNTSYKQTFNVNMTDEYGSDNGGIKILNENIINTKVNRKLIFDNNGDTIGNFEIIKEDTEKNRKNIEKIKNKYEWPAEINASNDKENSIVSDDDGNDKSIIVVNNGTGNKTPIMEIPLLIYTI